MYGAAPVEASSCVLFRLILLENLSSSVLVKLCTLLRLQFHVVLYIFFQCSHVNHNFHSYSRSQNKVPIVERLYSDFTVKSFR